MNHEGPIDLKTSINKNDVQIDFDNRVINGVIAIEPIDVKDYREFSINDEFITDLVSFAKKQKDGVLSNFGHNWNNLGRRLGRAKNWRMEDGKAKYDLHIYESADKSPGMQGMGSWVLSMADEDGKAIMNSIRFNADYFYQVDSGGAKLKVYYVKDNKGSRWVEPNADLGKVYAKFKNLVSTDIVDEGAATNSLLSPQDPSDKENFFTKLFEMAKSIFIEKDTAPGADLNITSLNSQTQMDPTQTVEKPQELAEDKSKEIILQKDNEIAALKQQLADEQKKSTDTLTALAARIDVLEKMPAAPETVLNTGAGGAPPQGEEEIPLWMKNPINQEAQKKFQRFAKKEQ